MIKKYSWIFIIVNLIAVLAYFNYSIAQKENLLSTGDLILLELAPVDPRSLMQGDYMRLDYAISQSVSTDSISKRGYCIVKLDSNGVGQRHRFQPEATPINSLEYAIKYNAIQYLGITIGAESYFFQEGTATKYEKAKYGGIKVDDHGNSLLVGLYDVNFQLIK